MIVDLMLTPATVHAAVSALVRRYQVAWAILLQGHGSSSSKGSVGIEARVGLSLTRLYFL